MVRVFFCVVILIAQGSRILIHPRLGSGACLGGAFFADFDFFLNVGALLPRPRHGLGNGAPTFKTGSRTGKKTRTGEIERLQRQASEDLDLNHGSLTCIFERLLEVLKVEQRQDQIKDVPSYLSL